jgi:hypothetical protein
MTPREPNKIRQVYAILDSLNVHRHGDFKTVVFWTPFSFTTPF